MSHQSSNYMTTHSLSSAFAPWKPISANVVGPLLGFGACTCPPPRPTVTPGGVGGSSSSPSGWLLALISSTGPGPGAGPPKPELGIRPPPAPRPSPGRAGLFLPLAGLGLFLPPWSGAGESVSVYRLVAGNCGPPRPDGPPDDCGLLPTPGPEPGRGCGCGCG